MARGGGNSLIFRTSKDGIFHYESVTPFEKWMEDGCSLVLCYREYGCCDHLLDEVSESVGTYEKALPPSKVDFVPKYIFVSPKAETRKSRSLSGEAYVTFPVNRTEVYPDYHENRRELGKIRATIDSVRMDKDVTITRIWLKGYASPESPYANNERLARGRSYAIRDYVHNLYPFPASVYSVDYEPENWEGLRKYVVDSRSLSDRDGILDIIDSGREPDAREWALKSRYPVDYRFLLQNCYPYLRRTDYRVEYNIRSYTDVREVLQILRDRPQNLSLNEFYMAAREFEEGSEDFNDVFATAVKMYPEDELANLNAAMAEMEAGKMNLAGRHLDRAGSSAEAVYGRGIWQALSGNYDEAEKILTEAFRMGVSEAAGAIENINAVRQYRKELADFTAKYGEDAL